MLKQVRGSVKIPVAVKLSRFISSIPNMAQRPRGEGADGLVLLKPFYQPEIVLKN